ncbi:MAG: WD repeat domain-containing protein [Lasallia pustulata]|uniref:WD repeat domain-containing protein n=1 Tax=Lasallia pustulata TaxID=136370 RepID=A0A5M8PFA2_9LECA|nr:MAG: WD repeat domain-containing protein [Lasallia pustulata]
MDQWLDSLSEEWVSQPRSSSSASLRRTSVIEGGSSAASKGSQSRIPRYQSRSSSNPAFQSSVISRAKGSVPRDGNDNKVLSERTSSNINAQRKRLFSGSTKFDRRTPGSKQVSGSKQHASTGSLPSQQQDTVQYRSPRPSPNKDSPKGTPEWRRRILNGDAARGEQRDLFSPIGLQSIFRPPTVRTKLEEKKGKRYQAFNTDYFPSSPPPYPSVKPDASARGTNHPQTHQINTQPENVMPEEERKHGLQQQPPKQVPGRPARRILEEHAMSNHGSGNMSSLAPSTKTAAKRQEPSTQYAVDKLGEDTEERPPLTAYRVDSGSNESTRRIPSVTITNSRTVSGLEELRNEKISPVTLSRQSTAGGRLQYVVPDLSAQPLSTGSMSESIQRQDRPSSSVSDDGVQYQKSRPEDDYRFEEIVIDDLTSQSLPDDLSMGTELFASKGGFVNLRRGGYSNDGSFRRRNLSPSSLPGLSLSALERHRSIDHNATNSVATSPITPSIDAVKQPASPERPRSSGSPLKLFGQYDTFTNDRLARRMSQFESSFNYSDETNDDMNVKSGDELAANGESSLHGYEDIRSRGPSGPAKQEGRRLSSFGEGHLDQYQFQKTIPSRSLVHHLDGGVDENRPPLPELQRGSHANFKFIYEREVIRNSEGKRLPNSPAKDPKAKRRRTLRGSERDPDAINPLQYQNEAGGSLNQSVTGRKRKDARYDNDNQAIDPKLIAMRQILRPRTPTPSQVRSRARKVVGETAVRSNDTWGKGDEPTDRKGADVPLQPKDAPTEVLAEQLATFALDIANEMTYGNRKTSVTTQDFFHEAKQIMQRIRTQGRPQSGRTSADDFEAEILDRNEESSLKESTKDEFSRPPSREGGSLRLARAAKQLDPRVLSHLRKFEEKDDPGLALSSSLRSLHIGRREEDGEDEHSEIESDPPNIRLIGNFGQSHKRKHSTSSVPELLAFATDPKSHSHNSQPSSGASTGRSIPTSSSNGSGNRAVIAPDKVSHLISGQIAGMTFDRSRQMWVKRKSSIDPGADSPSNTASEETEEDPLGEIPDLSVDEIEELRQIQTATSSVKLAGSISNGTGASDKLKTPRQQTDTSADHSVHEEARDTINLDAAQTSSAPSKNSRLTCSGPKIETRATSWADEVLASKTKNTLRAEPRESPFAEEEKHAEEVEHEISILEGRISTTPIRFGHGQRQARVITVAFSSPLVSHNRGPNTPREPQIWEDDGESNLTELPDGTWKGEQGNLQSATRRTSQESAARYRGPARRISIGHRSYVARPITRIDEQDELCFHQPQSNNRGTSLDVAISTPMPLRDLPGTLSMPPPSTSRHSNVSFHLSPLPDFTVHQTDEPFNRDVSYIVKHRGLLSLEDVESRFSLAIQELVKKITDIEPYEPYWDYIRTLNLKNRNLLTLHMLEEFCGRIEELDVSNNELGQLNGAPSSIRHLDIRSNCLSNMTAWGHLHNLQYLDVSGNQIQSLEGFSGLVHLRELIADDNHIESLDGILGLDGLIALRLRRNSVAIVDFEGTELKRLTELDLRGNRLQSLSSLHHLGALKSLDLSSNELETFGEDHTNKLFSLQSLNLSNNSLTSVDISTFPHLASIHLDGNHLLRVHGLETLKELQTLSWREQSAFGPEGASSLQYNDCYEARNLFLSGNVLPHFISEPAFLNLQHLEIASSGLHDLPSDFGTKISNLRTLNLNFNAIKDIRPLMGIVRLQTLFLAGNRISRLRRTTTVLAKACPGLSVLDLRANPLTIGFHAPSSALPVAGEAGKQVVVKNRNRGRADGDDDDANDSVPVAAKFLLPAADNIADEQYVARLDDGTKLRRRVYEMLVLSGCRGLEVLDGLAVERGRVRRRDGVWEKLVELGVLRERGVVGGEDEEDV